MSFCRWREPWLAGSLFTCIRRLPSPWVPAHRVCCPNVLVPDGRTRGGLEPRPVVAKGAGQVTAVAGGHWCLGGRPCQGTAPGAGPARWAPGGKCLLCAKGHPQGPSRASLRAVRPPPEPESHCATREAGDRRSGTWENHVENTRAKVSCPSPHGPQDRPCLGLAWNPPEGHSDAEVHESPRQAHPRGLQGVGRARRRFGRSRGAEARLLSPRISACGPAPAVFSLCLSPT